MNRPIALSTGKPSNCIPSDTDTETLVREGEPMDRDRTLTTRSISFPTPFAIVISIG